MNKEGKRFVNEAIGYPKIAELCTAQPDGIMIYIFDAPIHARDPFIKGVAPKKADTIAELAVLLGIKPEALVAGD
ncbi:MAG: hypothetical protein MZV70_15620 [Desulfobacterales bacterium]|nr:hypothetical protein [Desulfobacterales bacterium]